MAVDPSPESRARWAKRQGVLLVVALVWVLVVVAEVLTTSSPLLPLVALAVPIIMFGALVIYTKYRANPNHLPEGATWAAGGSLNPKQVLNAGLGDTLSFRSTWRLNFWTQGSGLV